MSHGLPVAWLAAVSLFTPSSKPNHCLLRLFQLCKRVIPIKFRQLFNEWVHTISNFNPHLNSGMKTKRVDNFGKKQDGQGGRLYTMRWQFWDLLRVIWRQLYIGYDSSVIRQAWKDNPIFSNISTFSLFSIGHMFSLFTLNCLNYHLTITWILLFDYYL